VYPRIDVDSELCEDDFSWNPSNRKPSKRKRSKYQLILDVAETFFRMLNVSPVWTMF